MEGLIAHRYAKALVGLTAESELKKTADELASLAETFATNEEVQGLITNPTHTQSQKVAAIGAIAEALGCSKGLVQFAKYVTDKGRFLVIETISRLFTAMAEDKLGIATAHIQVASELDQAQVADLEKQFSEYTKKKITLDMTINPEILGGAIATIGSIMLDGSIQNRLNMIRETISKGN